MIHGGFPTPGGEAHVPTGPAWAGPTDTPTKTGSIGRVKHHFILHWRNLANITVTKLTSSVKTNKQTQSSLTLRSGISKHLRRIHGVPPAALNASLPVAVFTFLILATPREVGTRVTILRI